MGKGTRPDKRRWFFPNCYYTETQDTPIRLGESYIFLGQHLCFFHFHEEILGFSLRRSVKAADVELCESKAAETQKI